MEPASNVRRPDFMTLSTERRQYTDIIVLTSFGTPYLYVCILTGLGRSGRNIAEVILKAL